MDLLWLGLFLRLLPPSTRYCRFIVSHKARSWSLLKTSYWIWTRAQHDRLIDCTHSLFGAASGYAATRLCGVRSPYRLSPQHHFWSPPRLAVSFQPNGFLPGHRLYLVLHLFEPNCDFSSTQLSLSLVRRHPLFVRADSCGVFGENWGLWPSLYRCLWLYAPFKKLIKAPPQMDINATKFFIHNLHWTIRTSLPITNHHHDKHPIFCQEGCCQASGTYFSL